MLQCMADQTKAKLIIAIVCCSVVGGRGTNHVKWDACVALRAGLASLGSFQHSPRPQLLRSSEVPGWRCWRCQPTVSFACKIFD